MFNRRMYLEQPINLHENLKKRLVHLPIAAFPFSPIRNTVLLRTRNNKKNKNKQWPWPCLGVSMETRPHYKALPTVCDWQASPAKDMPNKFEGTVETYPAGCKLSLLLSISTCVWIHLHLMFSYWTDSITTDKMSKTDCWKKEPWCIKHAWRIKSIL